MAADGVPLEEKLRAFLRTTLRVTREPIERDTHLMTAGLVDSVGVVRLASFLEKELGIRIPDRDVTVQHFDTLALIFAYLARRHGRTA